MRAKLDIHLILILAAVLVGMCAHSTFAVVNRTLYAKATTITMPDGQVVPAWGLATSLNGQAQIPGPLIEATPNEEVNITLQNRLTEPVSIVFPGQNARPIPVKNAQGEYVSFTSVANPGGSVTYNIRAGSAGSYLYESGAQPQKQVLMGLYGPMIVRPTGQPKRAYSDARSAFDVELLVILGEVDPALMTAASTGAPFQISQWNPSYWLINGRAYPQTVQTLPSPPLPSQPYSAYVKIGTQKRVLLRVLNAGFENHGLTVNGIIAKVIGQQGDPLWKTGLDATYGVSSLYIGSGEGYDLLLTTPSRRGKYHILDRDLLHLVNGAGVYPGGMIGLVEVE